jgi:hypothetical protein
MSPLVRRPSWPWVLLGGAIVTILLAIALFPGWLEGTGWLP